MKTPFTLRPATPADAGRVLALVRALAEYEKLAHEVVADERGFAAAIAGPHPQVEVLLAEQGGDCVGFALFFAHFSTFLGRGGLWLEDLFVQPQSRGQGIGKALLAQLAALAVARGAGRLEWSVLDWNAPALRFYESLGARALGDWTIHRLTGPALATLAGAALPSASPEAP